MEVLITGTSRGIGRAIACEFLRNGHSVTGMDVLPASIEENGYRHIVCDILTGELPQLCPEILINNAGTQNSPDDIDVNLKGTIRVTEKYAFHEKIKSVLFIASSSARTGAEFPLYSASKGGVVAYMKNTALRLAKFGAAANSLSPGGVITPLNEHIIKDPKLWEAVLNESLLGKWAEPEEIAKWAYFVTVVNSSMTGEDILIDNGEALKSNFIW